MANNGGVYTFSKTAASNAGSDSTQNWAEGMAPSAVNDSARALLASIAKYRDDISGAIVTTGTSSAYIVASNQIFDTAADFHQKTIAFTPHATNAAGPVTMTVDGFANLPLRSSPGVELSAGILVAGTPYVALYNNTDGALYLQGYYPAQSTFNIPLGGMIDFIGSTAPNSNFVFPQGQAISRTTYATLFALVGTTYGVGDGSTTFNVPDLTGRVSAMKEASATRLTSSWFGGNSTVLGATGFTEKNALSATNQLPQFTPSGSVALNCGGPGATAVEAGQSPTTESNGGGTGFNVYLAAVYASLTAAFTGTPVGSTTPASFATGQPTLIVNKLLRVL